MPISVSSAARFVISIPCGGSRRPEWEELTGKNLPFSVNDFLHSYGNDLRRGPVSQARGPRETAHGGADRARRRELRRIRPEPAMPAGRLAGRAWSDLRSCHLRACRRHRRYTPCISRPSCIQVHCRNLVRCAGRLDLRLQFRLVVEARLHMRSHCHGHRRDGRGI